MLFFPVMFLLLARCSAYQLQNLPLKHLHTSAAAGLQRRACNPVCIKQFREELQVGAVWSGKIVKIVNFGCFVSLGMEEHMGLIHISSLTKERLEREDVEAYIEDNVGPIGSKVSVEVLSLEFKGNKRTSLKLLEVLSQDSVEDIEEKVFAPGPLRQAKLDALSQRE
mmetsp:Transcript_54209/g.118218  ORF Transcript_54209/g.118218 Transcript_54209/m.118218 type:complete len:167 (-) Transcript_54209:189-689(-)